MATSVSGTGKTESKHVKTFFPKRWGDAALVITGDDATGTTIAPGLAGGTNYLVEQDEAAATVDASVHLFDPTLGLSSGVIYETWIYARSVNGDPIDFQWFVDGTARGAATTFSTTEWRSFQLADLQVTYVDRILLRDVTLRTSGGEVRVGNIHFLGRSLQYEAEDYIDTADGAALQADGGASGSSVLLDITAASGTDKRFLTGIAWPTGSLSRVPVYRIQARAAWLPGVLWGATFNPYHSDYSFNTHYFRNGTAQSSTPGLGQDDTWSPFWTVNWDSSAPGGGGMSVHQRQDFAAVVPSANAEFSYSPGDTIDVKIREQFLKARGWLDRFWFCGCVDDPDATSPGGPFVTADTITTPFTHPNNTIPTDYEGLILDTDTATVALGPSAVTYGSDYVVSASSLYTGNFRVVILANYDDGSYGFDSWDFSTTVDVVGVGQIYRRY